MENEKGNFIKINRSILEWRWFKDINTTHLFMYLLLKANWKDASFEGYEIKRGSLVTSLQTLSSETGLTVRQVRTALTHLQKTGEVTSKATNKFTIITIEKYSIFQGSQDNERQAECQTSDKQLTNKRQTTDKQATTIEEYKEYKEHEEIKEEKEELKKESTERKKSVPPFFDAVWKDIISLYPRRKGLEEECKVKYYEMLEQYENKEEIVEDTQAVITDYVERYDREHPNDTKREYILGFKRFFEEKFAEELQNYRNQKNVFTGWRESDKVLEETELSEVHEYKFDHSELIQYHEVLKEIYRTYPIHRYEHTAYESLYFNIVNDYGDATGANLLYASVGKYLEEMKNRKQYYIPELGYWLKYEAVQVMETITEFKKLIS